MENLTLGKISPINPNQDEKIYNGENIYSKTLYVYRALYENRIQVAVKVSRSEIFQGNHRAEICPKMC